MAGWAHGAPYVGGAVQLDMAGGWAGSAIRPALDHRNCGPRSPVFVILFLRLFSYCCVFGREDVCVQEPVRQVFWLVADSRPSKTGGQQYFESG